MSLVQTTIHVLLLLTPEVDPLSDIRFSEVEQEMQGQPSEWKLHQDML